MIGYESKISKEAVVIARWNGRTVDLEQGGLKIIKKFNQGQVNLICLQNFVEKNYELLGKVKKNQSFPDNCMTIRTTPQYQPKSQKHFFILQIKANDPAAREDLHLLASTISNVVILAVNSGENISYINCIPRRLISSSSNGFKDNGRTSSLLCLMPASGQKGDYLRQGTQNLLGKLEKDGILNQVVSCYPVISGFQCPEMALLESNPNFQQKVMHEIEQLSINKSNTEIMFGPILVKYMQNIREQMGDSASRTIDLQRAQDDISIDQGYDAYMAGVKTYHKVGLDLIDHNAKPDDNQLQEMLTVAKSKALDQFYSRQGSANTEYRRMLDQYINYKNNQVVGTYSSEQWNKNLQILQAQSKQVMDKIAASKTKDPVVVMQYIDKMTRNYEENAKGPQKYQILNDYMKVFTATALQVDPEKQARLKQELKKNQELLKRVQQLKKKKSGCCSSCVIM